MLNEKTYALTTHYYCPTHKKILEAHSYTGCTYDEAMDNAKFHQHKGFDVKVFEEQLVELCYLPGLEQKAAKDYYDEDEKWSEGDYDDWSDDEYDIRKEWSEI